MKPNTLIDDTTFSVLDIETTGLNHCLGDRICEIGILKVKNGKIIDSFQTLLNPKKPISPGASAVNGITDEMIKDAPTFSEIADKIISFTSDTCIVCHNAPFDIGFISRQIHNLRLPVIKNPVVDTLLLARKHFEFPSNRLGNIARFLDIEISEEHRAMGDIMTTYKILNYFIKEFKRRLDIYTLHDLLKLQGGSVKIPKPEKIDLPHALEQAIQNNKIIRIEYEADDGVVTKRELENIEVSKYKGVIYVIAHCRLKKEQRTFKLDKILKMDFE